MCGAHQAGKSTLMSVLTHGEDEKPLLCNGMGQARSRVFTHKHEVGRIGGKHGYCRHSESDPTKTPLSLSLSLSLSLCVDSFVGCCSSSSSGGVWQDEQHRPRVAGLRQARPLPELPDELGVLAPNPSRNVQRGRKNAQAFRSFGAREIPQDNVLRTDVPRPGLRHAHRVRPGEQQLHNPPRNTRQNFPPHQQS